VRKPSLFGRERTSTSEIEGRARGSSDSKDRIGHRIFGHTIHQTEFQSLSRVQLLGGHEH